MELINQFLSIYYILIDVGIVGMIVGLIGCYKTLDIEIEDKYMYFFALSVVLIILLFVFKLFLVMYLKIIY